jgi:LPXTG-motif cell wall-anchored protein
MIPSGSFAGLPTNNRTFYLKEKTPPEFHKALEGYIKFNLNLGVVTMLEPVLDGVELIPPASDSQSRIYTFKVTDEINGYRVRFKKTSMDINQPLQSADFTNSDMTSGEITLTSGEDGIMSYTDNGQTVSIFVLPISATPYQLTETKAPYGYILPAEPVKVMVTANAQTPITAYRELEDGTTINYKVEPPAEGDDVYTIIITNSNGVALPNTGGPGTIMYTLSGLMVLIASAVMYGFKRRHGERRSA